MAPASRSSADYLVGCAPRLTLMANRIKAAARYLFGLRNFFANPLSSEQCRQLIVGHLRCRDQSLIRVLEQLVYANPNSPYLALLAHAGAELGDLKRSVEKDGVESTLEKLYRAGVYISYDEFKCRQPIRRGNSSWAVSPADFDNASLASSFAATTGGTTGKGTRTRVDFEFLTHEAACGDLYVTCFGLERRPTALWMPLPPATSGLKAALRMTKLRRKISKWFSQNRFRPTPATAHYFLLAAAAIYGSRLSGCAIPAPEYVAPNDGFAVAKWLAEVKRTGLPGVVRTYPSAAVRVCRSALDRRLDIGESFFLVSGEPYTDAKAEIVAAAGCQAGTFYAMTETGYLGTGCAFPTAIDDVHLFENKLAVIQQHKTVGQLGSEVGALYYTALLASGPKVMINVESDDFGILERRQCACPAGALGLRLHLSHIRSYDKLTSEGMALAGNRLMQLVEDILPRRFGGGPSDYQFVEAEENGIPFIQVRISPRVGDVEESAVVEAVLDALRSQGRGNVLIAAQWRDVQTLRVARAEPYTNLVGKVLPLHILHRPKE